MQQKNIVISNYRIIFGYTFNLELVLIKNNTVIKTVKGITLNYKISWDQSSGIISCIYQGTVSLEDKLQSVDEVCREYPLCKPFRILLIVCDLIMALSLEQQRLFGEYLASHPDLKTAKVAVLHKPDYNPNLMIDVTAFNNGYTLAEFNNIDDANIWLLKN